MGGWWLTRNKRSVIVERRSSSRVIYIDILMSIILTLNTYIYWQYIWTLIGNSRVNCVHTSTLVTVAYVSAEK